MPTLREILLSEVNFPRVVADSRRLLDGQVDRKSGLSGLAIKGGFAAIKTFRPDIIERALEDLLPSFVDKMEPFYQKWDAEGRKTTLRAYTQREAPAIATSLLSITDERARKTQHKTLKSAYEKLRPMAQKHVEEGLPEVGEMVSRYLVTPQ